MEFCYCMQNEGGLLFNWLEKWLLQTHDQIDPEKCMNSLRINQVMKPFFNKTLLILIKILVFDLCLKNNKIFFVNTLMPKFLIKNIYFSIFSLFLSRMAFWTKLVVRKIYFSCLMTFSMHWQIHSLKTKYHTQKD